MRRNVVFVAVLIWLTTASQSVAVVSYDPQANMSLSAILLTMQNLYSQTKNQAKNIVRAGDSLVDLEILEKKQNEYIREIHSHYQRIGRGDAFYDAIDDVYNYKTKKKVKSVLELSEIGSEMGLKKDYINELKEHLTQAAHDFYYGISTVEEQTKKNIEKSQEDRRKADTLSAEGREKLAIKQNAQQYETQLLILDASKKTEQNTEDIKTLLEMNRLEKALEEAQVKQAFGNTDEVMSENGKQKNYLLMFMR